MKKIVWGALLALTLFILILTTGTNFNGAPVLAYVYSNSMEPLIKVNDAFIVWPTNELQVGDIVMYRPAVINAPYITHRIVGIGDTGYITKGDNSPYIDQNNGEPELLSERIVGKVVTVGGQPLIIPGLGKISESFQARFGKNTKYLAGVFFVLGVMSMFAGKQHRIRKSRLRPRIKHVYRIVTIIGVGLIIISIYLGSRITQINYLVSEYPGNKGNQVEVNKAGKLEMTVQNKGLIPVWPVISGIYPISVHEAPDIISPGEQCTVVLDVMPHNKTGIYQGYVQMISYPALLPRKLIIFLHSISPVLSVIIVGISAGIILAVFFELISFLHGFENWIPLKAISDKILTRRIMRGKKKLLGRKGVK